MVVKLLALGCGCTEKGTSRVDKVTSLVEILLTNEEILLFRTDGGDDSLRFLVTEKADYSHSLAVKRLHGTKKRSFLVESLSAV